jgi:hypothetical protein
MDENATQDNKRNVNLYTLIGLGCKPSFGTSVLSQVSYPNHIYNLYTICNVLLMRSDSKSTSSSSKNS